MSGLEDGIADKIYAAAADDSGDPAATDDEGNWIAGKILEYLQGLDPEKDLGKRLASSPVIRVMAIDETSVTFIIRGRMKIGPLKGHFEPFVRIEARVPKLELGGPTVTTFVADLHFMEPDGAPVTEVKMGLGYDDGVWLGRGGFRIIPVGFGLELFLGGLTETGIMFGINLYSPVPLPLGPVFGLNGLGGDYARNFKPRIEAGVEAENPPPNLESGNDVLPEAPGEIAHPTAYHYVAWARNPDDALDRWVLAPPEQHAHGVGVRAMFCDLPTSGEVLQLDPLGFAVLTPGPTIIFGGEGTLLTEKSGIKLEAYACIDVTSKSFALGGGVELEVPKDDGFVVKAEGKGDLFFSISEPKTWFIHFGTRKEPCKAKVFKEWGAEVFLELDHHKVAFGATVSYELDVGLWKIFSYFVKWMLGFAVLIGWNPKQLAGEIKMSGEIGIKIWKFKISLEAKASIMGHLPRPRILVGRVEVKLNLPWPIPDPKFKITLPKIEQEHPPEMRAALLEGADRPDVHAGALHPLSGRQWDLDAPSEDARDRPWPDSILAVHFSRRVTDQTGKVLGPAIGGEDNGGYQVVHALAALELTDLRTNQPVEGVQAVWAEGPEGEMGQLHVLAHDPYAWLTWSGELASSISMPQPKVVFQRFGIGAESSFKDPRAFGDLRADPQTTATLSNTFDFALPSRTIASNALALSWQTATGQPIQVDQLNLFCVEYRAGAPDSQSHVQVKVGGVPLQVVAAAFQPLAPGLYLVTYQVVIPAGSALVGFTVSSTTSFHLYGVLYRESRVPLVSCTDRVILEPGRYRLRLAGESTATSLHGHSNPDPVPWELTREFVVIAPPSLRPYLLSASLGDSRLFAEESLAWNPTPYGIGFPGYRAYVPVARFRTAYLSQIYQTIRVQLFVDDGDQPELDLALSPQPNPDGETSTLVPSEEFQEWVGCENPPDEELALPAEPIQAQGSAELRLVHVPPGQEPVTLDRWTCVLSQFLHFKEHLALAQTRLETVYGADGPQQVPDCLTGGLTTVFTVRGSHLDSRPDDFRAPARRAAGSGPLLPQGLPEADPPPYPDELEEPPLSWRLPSGLGSHLDDADAPLEISFARFAHDTGAAFSADPAHRLYGINDTVAATVVEGVVDDGGRLHALWLRTPEPVDWRRVSASLRVRHFKPGDDCPPQYAYRTRLVLEVEVLPSPDGSSAFLVGSLGGIRTRLPRGEYELTLSFDPAVAGLPRLRAMAAVGVTPEVVVAQFLQLSGENWPLPSEALSLPAVTMERLLHALEIPSSLVHEVMELDPSLPAEDHRVTTLIARLRSARGQGSGRPARGESRVRAPAGARANAPPPRRRQPRRRPRVLQPEEGD